MVELCLPLIFHIDSINCNGGKIRCCILSMALESSSESIWSTNRHSKKKELFLTICCQILMASSFFVEGRVYWDVKQPLGLVWIHAMKSFERIVIVIIIFLINFFVLKINKNKTKTSLIVLVFGSVCSYVIISSNAAWHRWIQDELVQ